MLPESAPLARRPCSRASRPGPAAHRVSGHVLSTVCTLQGPLSTAWPLPTHWPTSPCKPSPLWPRAQNQFVPGGFLLLAPKCQRAGAHPSGTHRPDPLAHAGQYLAQTKEPGNPAARRTAPQRGPELVHGRQRHLPAQVPGQQLPGGAHGELGQLHQGPDPAAQTNLAGQAPQAPGEGCPGPETPPSGSMPEARA